MCTDSSIQNMELVDITNKLPVLILLRGKNSLKIDPLSLDLCEHFQCLWYLLQVVLPCLDLVLKVVIEKASFLSWQNPHVVLEGCKYCISSFYFPCFFVRFWYYLEALPFLLYFIQGAFNLVLLSSNFTSIINCLGMTNKVLLNVYLIKSKILALWIKVNVSSQFCPMSGSDERLSQEIN